MRHPLRHSLLFTAASAGLVTTLALSAPLGSAAVPVDSTDSTSSTTSSTTTSTTTTAARATEWRQVFSDDFSGDAISTSKWAVYTGGQRRAENVVVGGGHLSLKTKRTASGWTASGVTSARALTTKYGKFVARVRLEKGQGTRAVALLWPTGGVWPPEIDFFEVSGNDPERRRNLTANHYMADGVHKIQHALVEADYTQWHTVGVIWEQERLRYLLDGRVVATVEGKAPQREMWLGLQTATGTGTGAPVAGTPDVVDFDVDWVKAFKRQ